MPATTTLLGLVTPTQGTLSGTWGDTVNYGISDYVDISVAGTLTLTNDGAVTLANTTGSSSGNSITSSLTGAGTVTAQFAIVKVTGTLTVAKVVTGPSYSKTYTVVNSATGGIVTFKASGQTGVSIAVGETAFVYYNGTDYVKVSGTVAVASFQTSLGGLTPSTATTGVVTLAGTLNTTSGGTGLTSFTAGDVPYYASGSVLSKLAIGTAGQFLTSTGTAPQWSTLSGVAVTTFSAGTTGFTPSSATSGVVTLAGTLATTNGGTGLTAFTANQVFYASSTSAFAQSANLTFNGTTLTANTIGAFTLAGTVAGGGNQINNVVIGASTPLAGAFTTVSATGSMTSGGLVTGTALTANGAASYKSIARSGTNDSQFQFYAFDEITSQGFFNAQPLGLDWYAPNTTKVLAATSTGLAVTGALSATGTLSGGTSGTAYSFSGSAPATSLTLTSGGDVGIGTSSPQNLLQVKTTTRPQFSVSYNGTTGLYLEDGTNSSWKSWKLSTSFGAGSDLSFVQSTNTSGVPTWAASAAMTLDVSGNLLVNSTSTLNAVFSVTAKGGISACSLRVETDGDYGYTFKNASNTFVGAIGVNASTTSYVTSSDYRLKNTIALMTGALAKVAQLKPCTYKWNVDGSDGEGFIAHELAEVCPSAVTGEKDAVNEDGSIKSQGIDTSFLVATLTAAIQEQQALITQLTARITALETA